MRGAEAPPERGQLSRTADLEWALEAGCLWAPRTGYSWMGQNLAIAQAGGDGISCGALHAKTMSRESFTSSATVGG
jgi:threonine/homoserine efflux transporter RhtA